MGDMRYLTGSQAAMLSPVERSGLRLDVQTGEYLRYVGDETGNAGQYEVVFSPQKETPKFDPDYSNTQLVDWLKMDPSNRPQPEWGTSSFAEATKKLKQELSNMFLYGSTNPIWSVSEIEEEKEMEIGGNQCHLCGEGLLYTDINRTFIKKHRKVESHKVYMCGTTIYETWNEHDVQPHETKRTRRVHAECLC